jgi:hypothetical protein
MSWDWLQLQCAKNGVALPPRHTIITVNGTGIPDPFGSGFAGDVGRGVNDELWFWQPIGYPAAVMPMGPSVAAGITEVLRQIDLHPGTFALSGYSQGAIVTGHVWRDHLLSGSHNHRLSDCLAVVNFGDPLRCPGVANGNKFAGMPLPKTLDGVTTGGIAGPDDLTAAQTPDNFLSFALDGDLYASAPVGDDPHPASAEAPAGADETLIYNLIQSFSFSTILGFAEYAVKFLNKPLAQVIPLIEAIINGLTFAAAGTSAPHWQYQGAAAAAVGYLNELGANVPA